MEIPAHELSISATHRLIPEWAVLAERALPDGDDGIPSTCGIFNADSPKRNLAGVVSPGLSVQSLARPPYPQGAPPIGAPDAADRLEGPFLSISYPLQWGVRRTDLCRAGP